MDDHLVISPYTSRMVTLRFGQSGKAYYVSCDLLYNQSFITLNDNDYDCGYTEDIGHVLVHFIYTGTYQTLVSTKRYQNTRDQMLAELQIAAEVLFASNAWNLPGLCKLAEIMIHRLCKSIKVLDAVDIIDTVLLNKEKDNSEISRRSKRWLKEFLISSLQEAFDKNDEMFQDIKLFEGLENLELINVLSAALFNMCYSRLQESLEREKQLKKSLAAEKKLREAEAEEAKTEESDSLSLANLILNTSTSDTS
ncbi:hypothetical protein GcC1_042027 [Golovinomyces cichoracearum]|uniref:BTB domain-containing protein n=1 Tax=Golovinomyces cichoracearum TaxID=62708 RepID=A0A420IZ33_9PEZI|nr:hypothetical protein GcC1_042027 [Golovinomyces cichoracearum]